MSITVKYFASIRENLGKSEEAIDPVGISSVRDVWQRASGKPVPDRLLAAINQEYADLHQRVRDGDEVAFFPPVTGG